MESLEAKCLNAFCTENKEEVLILLPELQPHTVKDLQHDGCTLLHYASMNGWADVCQLLVEKYECTPGMTDMHGDNLLHKACRRVDLPVALIVFLLSTASLSLTDKNNYGHTPFDYITHNYETFSELGSIIDWTTEGHIRPLCKVFIVGNTAAGKSSLSAVIEELSNSPSQQRLVSGVKPLTAGIHTTQCRRYVQ